MSAPQDQNHRLNSREAAKADGQAGFGTIRGKKRRAKSADSANQSRCIQPCKGPQ